MYDFYNSMKYQVKQSIQKYDYFYDVPIKKIDLTFDKPYFFIIRDKNTN